MDVPKHLIKDGMLSIRVDREADEIVIEACGELDLASAEALDRELRLAEESDAEKIVLDLSRLDFIDSTGLTLLVVAARRSDMDSRRLWVRRGAGQVAKVMELTGIDRVVRILD